MSESNQVLKQRRQKADELAATGINLYGNTFKPSHRVADILPLGAGITADSLASLWESHADLLLSERWDRAAQLGQTLITPSCGTGSLAPELALRVLELTRDVSAKLRAKYL